MLRVPSRGFAPLFLQCTRNRWMVMRVFLQLSGAQHPKKAGSRYVRGNGWSHAVLESVGACRNGNYVSPAWRTCLGPSTSMAHADCPRRLVSQVGGIFGRLGLS